jgi:uncharacterized membrane protein required for colicin V production
MRETHIRSVRTALAVFLVKIRLGLINRVLASLFHLKDKRIVSDIIHLVRLALIKDFTPHHIGLQHIDR